LTLRGHLVAADSTFGHVPDVLNTLGTSGIEIVNILFQPEWQQAAALAARTQLCDAGGECTGGFLVMWDRDKVGALAVAHTGVL
jgi:hypothetical protein